MDIQSSVKEKLNEMLQADVIKLLADKPNDLADNIKLLVKLNTTEEYLQYINELKTKYDYTENGVLTYLEAATGQYKLKGIDKQIDLDVLSKKEIEGLVDNLGEYVTASLFYDKKKLSYAQTEYLTNYIMEDYKKLVFVVTPETKMRGKIINQEWEGKITMPIAYHLVKKRREGDGGEDHWACLYATSFDKKSWSIVDELTDDYYGYRFYDVEGHREVLVLSREELNSSDSIEGIEGLMVCKKDCRIVGSDSRLNCYTTIIHLTKTFRQTPPYFVALNTLASVGRSSLPVEYICSTIYNQYRHPQWFEKLILYILFSGKKEYPLHFFILNPGAGGKTTLYERIAKVMNLDENNIWDGEQSTIKSLIPNFNEIPPDCGFLARQRYVGLLDEFFGRNASEENATRRYAEYGSLKTILEHKRRIGRSGKGNVKVIPTAQFFFSSNYKFGITNLASLMDKTDEAFIERLLIYFQNEEHANFVSERKSMVNLSEQPPETDLMPFMKDVILYFKSFVVEGISVERISQIKEELMNVIAYDSVIRSAVQTYIKARCDHHLILLLDGIVKFRHYCSGVIDKDKMFITEEDYNELKTIMEILAQSWARSTNIHTYSLNARVNLLGGKSRQLYDWVQQNKGHILESDFVSYALQEIKLSQEEYKSALATLIEWGVIIRNEGLLHCFWWKPKEVLKVEKQEVNAGLNEQKQMVLEQIRNGANTLQQLEFLNAGVISSEVLMDFVEEFKKKGLVYEDPEGFLRLV